MTSDRLDLQRMEKKSRESFKEYVQRWRDTSAQVQPPLTDEELSIMFINTLKSLSYDRMIGSATTNFSNIMMIGERIKYGIKHGKVTNMTRSTTTKKRVSSKKKEGKVQMVGEVDHFNTRQQPYLNAEVSQCHSNYYPPPYAYHQPYINNTSTQYSSPYVQIPCPVVNPNYQPQNQQTSPRETTKGFVDKINLIRF